MVLLTSKKWSQKPIGATAECQIHKQLYIINLLSFIIPIIIYTTSQSITHILGTLVAQPLLHLTVPHGSRSSLDEPIVFAILQICQKKPTMGQCGDIRFTILLVRPSWSRAL